MANVIINGVTYPDPPAVDIPKAAGGTMRFYDTSSANITSSDLLTGKTGFGANGSVSGGIPVNGATGGTISTKAGTVTIPAGHTTGGSVKISDAEQAKIIASNIKSGVTILGQAGSLTLPTITQDSQSKVLSIS